MKEPISQTHKIEESLLQKWLTYLGDVPAKYANPLINELQTFVLNSRKATETSPPKEETKK